MRWLARGAMVIGLLFVGIAAFLFYQFQLPVPTDPARISAPGLSAPVTIRYDHRRRPFVEAANFDDAVFAEGWLHARERYWQMELLRRAGKGRLAELLGPAMLDTDIEMIRAGVTLLADRMASNADPETLAVIDAYVAGINLAVADLEAPVELRLLGGSPAPWTREDVFAVGGIMAFQSGRNIRNELLRLSLMADLSEDRALIFAPGDVPHLPAQVDFDNYLALEAALDPEQPFYQPPLLGSNGWVVGPARSESGNALFAFDSHDGWGMPSLYYEMHLFFGADAEESVRGFSVVGLPGAINGFNSFMAWGFTNIGDSQDLYLEIGDPDNPLRFKGRSGWYQADVEVIEVPVAGSEPHRLEVVRTENGPLIQPEPPVSLRWSALEIGDEYGLDGLISLNRATSLDAFMAAIDRFPAPSANVTYADVAGNIAWRTVGLLPERGKGQGLVPLAADDPEGAWRRLLPLTELPRSLNPSSGYLVKANARVLPEPPLISADNAPGYRQARLEELLAASGQLTFEDMARWQGDWFNKQAQWLLPELLAVLGAERSETPEAIQLAAWLTDPSNDADLAAPLLFNQWYIALADAVFASELGPEKHQALIGNSYLLNHALDRLILDEASSPWWRGAKEVLIRDAFVAVLDARRAGAPDGKWGDSHQVLFRHEMSGAVPGLSSLVDRGPYAWGGGNPTVGRARFRYDRPFTATGGATIRLVIEMSQPMRIGAVMPGGQSGHPASPYYDDQIDTWLRRELDPVAVSPRLAGEVVTTLVP